MPVLFLASLFSLISLTVLAADITAARFALPTEKYDHCVLGDCTEYEAVEAVLDDGRILSYRLDEGSVFEDVEPRLIKMGLNGRNAILVVRSYMDQGAALALLDQRGGKLAIVAQSDPIGTSHRWQNPIGLGDFDHDRKMEIATIITPHIGGKLTLYERRGKKLVADKTAFPFSNHRIGSSQLDLHEIVDWNQDKTVDIAVPDVTRRVLKIVSFLGGEAKVIAEKEFDHLIEGPITQTPEGHLEIGMDDGNTEIWERGQ